MTSNSDQPVSKFDLDGITDRDALDPITDRDAIQEPDATSDQPDATSDQDDAPEPIADQEAARAADAIRETLIPLHAEELSVSKERVETGRVHVGTVTRTHDEVVDEDLASEHAQIERVPVNQPVDAVPPVRQEGNVTIVPVLEEVLVLERRLMLKEEIHIRRVHTTEKHRERVTLRRQEAVISRTPATTLPE